MIAEVTSQVTIGDRTYRARVATILSTYLGIEDHGLFVATLETGQHTLAEGKGGWVHSFGPRIIGGDTAESYITTILNVVGVRSWESLKGKIVYLLDEPSESAWVSGIMNLHYPELYFIP